MTGTATGAVIITPPHIIPPTVRMVDPDMAMLMLPYLAVACVGGLLGWITAAMIRKRFGVLCPLNIILPSVATVLMALRFGFGAELMQGVIFSLLLLYAVNSDIHTREVPDCVPVMIAITGCIGTELSDIPLLLIAAVLITLPQLIIAVRKPGSYGGADIKLMAASGFLLGLGKGLFAMVIGLLLSVLCTFIYRKAKKRNVKEAFALVPYLAIGCMAGFFL